MTIMAVELTHEHVFWWGTVLEGAAGAAAGAVVSVGIALLVLWKTHKNDADRARLDAGLMAAEALTVAIVRLHGKIHEILPSLFDPEPRANALADECRRLTEVITIKSPALVKQGDFAAPLKKTLELLADLSRQADWLVETFWLSDGDTYDTMRAQSPGPDLAAALLPGMAEWLTYVGAMLGEFRAGNAPPPEQRPPTIPYEYLTGQDPGAG